MTNLSISIVFMTLQDRKKIVKGMKGHVSKIARDEHGSMVSRKLVSM
jgi:hypothetical protein